MNMSLLTEAKKTAIYHKWYKDFSDEDVDLVLAWLGDDICAGQVIKVKSFKGYSQFYNYALWVLKDAYRQKKLIIGDKK
mgnify:CR=1 FL=1